MRTQEDQDRLQYILSSHNTVSIESDQIRSITTFNTHCGLWPIKVSTAQRDSVFRTMTVWVVGSHIFVSPNALEAPIGFNPISPNTGAALSLSDIHSANWAHLSYPQLGYCLSNPYWSGPLLDRLDVTALTVEVERKHGRWLMEVTLQQSWVSLELALVWMARTLLSEAKG
ncbi:hypothetical protein EIP91_009940, partial [Steccherinum ochraceum]